MSSSLDPKLVEGVLRKNLSNILEKVKAGKTLSKQERELFEQHAKTEAPEEQIASSQWELAKRLGVSRQTVNAWKKRYPDEAPADLSISKWKIFQAAISSRGTAGTAIADLARRKAEGEVRKIDLACEKLELEVAELRGAMMSREEQQAEGEAVGIIIQSAFESLSRDLDAKISGQPPEERRVIIRKICNEHLTNIKQELGKLV